MPRQWLSWHYRSQDESLIAFSNAQYYENRLSSFPAPTHGRASAEPDGRGVSLVRVAGTFHRSGAGRLLRTNPIEAKAIVAEIRRRFDLVPKSATGGRVPSIGVVTFNAQQRAYIEALLRDADDDRLAAALDRTDGEGLFVKNLENVQGDERDVVFFSTGFSPNANGDAAAELRPAEPGRRRAAAQRGDHPRAAAGRRLLVVRPGAAAGRGDVVGRHQAPARLPRPGRAGHRRAAARRRGRRSVVDRHREEIAAALRERGLVVRTDVGLSEFRVDLSIARPVDPETPVMAVLLDGPGVGAAPHGRRPRRAAGRGARRDAALAGGRAGVAAVVAGRPAPAVVDRLVASVDDGAGRAGARPRRSDRSRRRRSSRSRAWRRCASAVTSVGRCRPSRARSPKRTPKPAGPVGMDGETAFVPWIPKTAGEKSVLDELPTAKAARAVRKVLTAGIKAEGPIHVDRLTKLTVGAFGLNRVERGAQGGAAVDAAAVGGGRATTCGPRASTRPCWTASAARQSSTDRPIDHVPPEEIAQRDGGAVPRVGRDAPRGAAHPGRRGVRLQAPYARDDPGPGGGAERGRCTAAGSPSSRTAC